MSTATPPEPTGADHTAAEPATAGTDPTGTDDAPGEARISALRQEIDRLDAEILAAVRRRSEVSREVGRARMSSGGTRLVHTRELKVIERFSELGDEGKTLAMLLLRLGRGRLGR